MYVDIKRYTKNLDQYIRQLASNQAPRNENDNGFVANNEYYSARSIMDKNEHYMTLSDFSTHLKSSSFSTIQRQLAKETRSKSITRKSIQSDNGDVKLQNSEYYMADSLHNGSINEEEENRSVVSYSMAEEKIKSEKFTGYMNEKSASYNLYLRVGIGGKSV